MPGLPSVFRRLLKESSARQLAAGWRLRGAGLELRAHDGCWGQIVFSGASREATIGSLRRATASELVREAPILWLSLTAGTCAPYLMRTVNKLNPLKPPTRNFVANHAAVCFDVRIVFAQAVRQPPRPFEIPERRTLEHYYVDVESGEAWLTDALSKLAPATEALCSNEAIYAYLGAQPGYFLLRDAYLLARHLGHDNDLPALEERARQAWEESNRQYPRERYADRQATYPQDWSHERFMRFVDDTAP